MHLRANSTICSSHLLTSDCQRLVNIQASYNGWLGAKRCPGASIVAAITCRLISLRLDSVFIFIVLSYLVIHRHQLQKSVCVQLRKSIARNWFIRSRSNRFTRSRSVHSPVAMSVSKCSSSTHVERSYNLNASVRHCQSNALALCSAFWNNSAISSHSSSSIMSLGFVIAFDAISTAFPLP